MPPMDHGDCSETLHELYHFLDGELTDEKRAQIQQHLEGCPPCFEAFDFEAEIKHYIAQKCRDRVRHQPPATPEPA
jgi:mycothiol system anti-sigma-R factor